MDGKKRDVAGKMTLPQDISGGFGSRQEREKWMEQKHVEKIKGYYDRNGEFKRNEKYSGKDQTVYTKEGDKYRWLVMEPQGASGMEVTRTDMHGKITARDTYESVRNVVYCTGIERLCKDGRGMVQFTADEAALINRLGGNGGKDTAANFERAVHGAADGYEKKMISRAAHKLSELSEESCMELIATTKNRKLSEQDFSVRQRRKEMDTVKGKDRGGKWKKAGWSYDKPGKRKWKTAERDAWND